MALVHRIVLTKCPEGQAFVRTYSKNGRMQWESQMNKVRQAKELATETRERYPEAKYLEVAE